MSLKNDISFWIKDYVNNNNLDSLVIGVSGGIDSAVTSTLCAMTGKKTVVIMMPLHSSKMSLSKGHANFLSKQFDNVEVRSAGDRDPDAEGTEGMSASKMRAAAADGDFDSFKQGLPLNFKDGKKLYRDVRAGMGIREERMMGDMNDIEFLRDLYLTGKKDIILRNYRASDAVAVAV